MTNRRLLFLLPALLGYLAIFFLFERFDPSARWNYSIDRSQAIAIARREAFDLGYIVDGWDEKVDVNYSSNADYYLAQQSNPVAAGIYSPITTAVNFRDLRTNRRLIFSLNNQGKLIGLRVLVPEDKASDKKNSGTQVADFSIPESFAKKILSSSFNRFTLSDAGSQNGSNYRRSWVGSDERVRITVNVETKGNQITRLLIDPTITDQMKGELSARRSTVGRFLSGAGTFTFLPAALLIVLFYFSGLGRRQIHHPTTMIFLGLVFLFAFVTNVMSEFYDSQILGTNFSIGGVNYWVALLVPKLIFILINLAIALGAYVTWSAAQALALRVSGRRTLSIEMLLKGKILTRPVTAGFLVGLMAAGLLAALPYIVLATGLFPKATLGTSGSYANFVAHMPSIAAITTGREFLAFAIFAFFGSLIDASIKRRTVARAVFFLVSFVALQSILPIENSAPAIIISGILTTVLLVYIYYGFGILSVMVAIIGGQLTVNAAAMIAQPASSLDRSGWIAMGYIGVGMIAGLAAWLKSREATPEEMAVPENLVTGKIERDRLKAEFDVARRAQQKMLPDSEPAVHGFDISAVCLPSKEVGGDLYDFLQMKDGRLGIVVADVSGKGVPASLYMTLTKGLLDSITEIETDPGEILRAVNHHLYEVCRRKVFVTLFLGIIDPVTRRFDFARAGHNPPVLFRPGENTTQLLKPHGMGLGLNSGRVFDQSLKVDSIDLKPGDLLLIYSDGITEAMNFKNEEFGEERLEEFSKGMNGLPANQVRDNVMSEVTRFLGNIPPQDDQTLVVVRVN